MAQAEIRKHFAGSLTRTHANIEKHTHHFIHFSYIPPSQLRTIRWGPHSLFLPIFFYYIPGDKWYAPLTCTHTDTHTYTHLTHTRSCIRIMVLDRIYWGCGAYTILPNDFGRHPHGCQLSFRLLNTISRVQ